MSDEELARAIAKLDYENLKADTVDRLKYQIDLGLAAIRGLILVNGGGIVALFTFIGSSSARFAANPIWWAFAFFVAGLSCSLAATVAGFYSQLNFMNSSALQMWSEQAKMFGRRVENDYSTPFQRGNICLSVGMAFIFFALISFCMGSGFALRGVLVV